MATTFPVSTYPLIQDAGAADHDAQIVIRDIMDDGSPRVRVMGSDTWVERPMAFIPMSADDAALLVDYLTANAGTLFSVTYMSGTWEGYLWSDPKTNMKSGKWFVTTSFYGKKVA